MNGMERLARAERDCVDLHRALAEAIRRMKRGNETGWIILYDDLVEVLDRTSQLEDTPAARQAQLERALDHGGWVG